RGRHRGTDRAKRLHQLRRDSPQHSRARFRSSQRRARLEVRTRHDARWPSGRGGDGGHSEFRAAMIRARLATPADAVAIAAIYNEGIEDRVATFETRHRSADDIRTWFGGGHPVVVVENGEEIVAFAGTSTYRSRPCYAGIAEFSVYVARRHRGHGHGRTAMEALCAEAERAGFWKIVSRVFVENTSSRR